MSGREQRAAHLRPRVRAAVKRYRSQREAAADIPLSHTALNKFLGGETPYDPTLDKYESWLRRIGAIDSIDSGGGNGRAEVEQILEDRDQVVRYLRMAGDPGEDRLRKLAILRGYREVFAALGAVPGWFYELEQRVDKGEL